MAASPKEKFDAAVNVIQSLPKNGSFQPSHDLMLKFYAYYKQATLGKCDIPRPAFWDVVGKAKWDAWNKLDTMPPEQAMINYVDELKKIIEAMPHTQMVSEFVEKLSGFYELVDEDEIENQRRAKLKARLMPNGDAKGTSPNGMGESPTKGSPVSSSPTHSSPAHSSGAQSSPAHSSPAQSSPAQSSPAQSTPSKSIAESDASIESEDQSQLSQEVVEEEAITELLTDHVYSMPAKLTQYKEPPKSNGVVQNGNGHMSDDGDENDVRRDADSESDGEEFCDTSDLLQPISPAESSASQQVGGYGTEAMVIRGGGEVPSGGTDRRGTGLHRSGSTASMSSQGRGVNAAGQGPPRRGHFAGAAGGSGGEDRDPAYQAPLRAEVNEQIAIALVRLQQDMSSVLTRLSTLEALSVAQHQLNRSRSTSESERQTRTWWWPFPNVSSRTVFFIVVWPFIVQWILSVISRRRHRRR